MPGISLAGASGAVDRLSLPGAHDGRTTADTELAREYSLHVDTEYLPLNIYTREVDYTDPEVQVRRRSSRRQAGVVVEGRPIAMRSAFCSHANALGTTYTVSCPTCTVSCPTYTVSCLTYTVSCEIETNGDSAHLPGLNVVRSIVR